MKLLAIDTSTDYLSVAVLDGATTLARTHRKVPRSHSSLLMPTIDACIRKARLKLADIDGYIVSAGPGSFTGLRIGVTTVKGLAFATARPIAAVPTLDAIAGNARKKCGILCTVLDARKGKVYACIYRSDGSAITRLSKYLLLPLQDLLARLGKYENVRFLGDFAERASSVLPGSSVATNAWHPKPETVGRLGLEYFRKRKFVSVEDLEPLYLYSSECDITGK